MIWVLAFLLAFSVVFNIGIAALYSDYNRRLVIALATIRDGNYIALPDTLIRELKRSYKN